MRKKEADAAIDIRQSMTTYYQPTKLPSGESPKEREAQLPTASGRSWQKKLLLSVGLLVLALLVSVLIVLFMDWRNFSSAAGKLFGSSSLMDMFPTSQLQTSPEDNVHVLIAGYSADDPGHGGATLTDTIMVLNVNKHTGKGYMLSIPRDLYVQIPGNGSAKINEVYQDGESDEFSEPGYPPGGMGLLTKTVEEVTGMDIHYNFLVNYAAVRDITDALGGIEVNISSPDQRGVYDPGFKPTEGGALKLPNGTNKIDGETALKITRARGLAAGSYGYPQADFNRTQYQQTLMTGILKGLTWQLVLNPQQNKRIFNAVADNVKTNFQLDEVIPFFRVVNAVDVADLSTQTLRSLDGKNYVTSYQTPLGQSALVPTSGRYNYTEIHSAVAKLNVSISH